MLEHLNLPDLAGTGRLLAREGPERQHQLITTEEFFQRNHRLTSRPPAPETAAVIDTAAGQGTVCAEPGPQQAPVGLRHRFPPSLVSSHEHPGIAARLLVGAQYCRLQASPRRRLPRRPGLDK